VIKIKDTHFTLSEPVRIKVNYEWIIDQIRLRSLYPPDLMIEAIRILRELDKEQENGQT
jgi:hypothetical protein